MPRLYNSANLTRLILLFSGTALMLIGFYGIAEDFVHSWRIEEYSSFAALLSGAAILLATTIVYLILPEYQSHRRLELLRQYYIGTEGGEVRDIRHNIMERAQGIVAGAELLTQNIRDCVRDDTPYEICKDKILEARAMLEHVNGESSRLRKSLDKLDEYVSSKKTTPEH